MKDACAQVIQLNSLCTDGPTRIIQGDHVNDLRENLRKIFK